MAFAKGSLVVVDYTGRTKDGEVFDTTRAEDAAKAGLPSDKKYAPMLVSVGAGWVLKGLDEALEGAELDKEVTVEVPPAKGFGEVSYSKIRVMRSRKLGDEEEKASVGDRVEIDGKSGTIRHMGSGRVKVDFNHRHAGKTLVYDIRVLRAVETDGDKVEALLDRHLPDREDHAHDDGVLSLHISDHYATPAVKQAARIEIFRLVPSVRMIKFIDAHTNPNFKPAEAPPAGGGSAEVGPEPRAEAPPEPAGSAEGSPGAGREKELALG